MGNAGLHIKSVFRFIWFSLALTCLESPHVQATGCLRYDAEEARRHELFQLFRAFNELESISYLPKIEGPDASRPLSAERN